MYNTTETLTLTNISTLTLNRQCGDPIIIAIIIPIIMFCAAIGNSLVIGANFLDSKVHSGGQLPMLTLAISDLVFAEFTCITILYVTFGNDVDIIKTTCLILGIIEFFFVSVMILQHCLLAIIQWMAICHPVKYRGWVTTRHILCILLGIYLTACLISIIPSVVPNGENPLMEQVYDHSLMICIFRATNFTLAYMILFYFLVPAAICGYCYVNCWITLKKKASGHPIDSVTTQQKRMAWALFVSYAIVLFNSTPFPVTYFVLRNPEECSLLKRHLCWFIFANTCCNPMVYAVKSAKYRHLFARQLGIKMKSTNRVSPLISS